jgi:hypothetical protein
MSQDIPESDWKIFRQLHPIALERYCKQVLSDIGRIRSNASKSPHQRYLDIFALVRDRDKELAELFDDMRRSTARFQLSLMHSRGLLTEDELQHFSPETRQMISASETDPSDCCES